MKHRHRITGTDVAIFAMLLAIYGAASVPKPSPMSKQNKVLWIVIAAPLVLLWAVDQVRTHLF